MTVWEFVERNKEVILALLSFIAGVTGLKEWARRKEASWIQVRDWAMVAADATIAAAHNGLIPINADLVAEWRTRLLEFAEALGFSVDKKMMMKALAQVQKKLTETAVRNQFDKVTVEATEMIRAKMLNGAVEPIKPTRKKPTIPPPTLLLIGVAMIIVACAGPATRDPTPPTPDHVPVPDTLKWDHESGCWTYGPVTLPNPVADDGSTWDVSWKACPETKPGESP